MSVSVFCVKYTRQSSKNNHVNNINLRKMSITRLPRLLAQMKIVTRPEQVFQRRTATTTPTGAILPEPEKKPFGLLSIVAAVVPGLLIGAAISKNIANFLEENELFVPSDDDDDDD
ncbi:essential MCU regulator, mitochondrial [Ostrinia nubilalis]|uniref:essential MCU regulator, mitochondrial n=1 Tax=Ostrinia furnacalis TaxID=93504 RepID=UPI0010408A00|nr:essential MCU regulator, mitochondrial [Ostrinia furnacalis]